jgi:hypothetical protein
MSLAQALAGERPSDFRTGAVTAVTSRGVSVQVGTGLVENAAHLTSYNPAVGDTVAMTLFNDSWVVLGRLLGPGTPTDYTAPGTGIGAQLLDGCVLSGGGAVMASSTGSVVAVPRYGVTFYHPIGHWVELRWLYNWFSTATNDVLIVQLVEAYSGTTLQIVETQGGGGVGSAAEYGLLTPPTLGGAKRSWSMTVQRFAGAGTSRIEDPAARRGKLLAYDAGDQVMIRTV